MAEPAQNLPAETGDAAACLTPELMEDDRLVTLVRGVGPPPPFAMRGDFGDEHKDWVVGFLAELPSPSMAARVMGVTSDTLYYHRDRDAAFRARWQQATLNAREAIVGAAAEEALGYGVDHVVTKDGGAVAIPKRRSERLLDSWMKFLLGERHIHEGGELDPGTMYIEVSPAKLEALTGDERRQLTLILAKLERVGGGQKVIDVTPEPSSSVARAEGEGDG